MKLIVLFASLLCFFSIYVSDVKAADVSSVKSGVWTDPSVWNLGRLPDANDVATVSPGHTITMPSVNLTTIGIVISAGGKLSFSDQATISITTEYIGNFGIFSIGTESNRFSGNALITFVGNDRTKETFPTMAHSHGTKALFGFSGSVTDLHGELKTPTWTKLNKTATKGSTQIVLDESVQWSVGDKIVIATTDYDLNQAEERTITAVNGNTVSFSQPLKYMHYGELQSYGGRQIDTRGAVGHLTRNIHFTSNVDDVVDGFGGHTMFMRGADLRVDSIEYSHMGQSGILARYPVHYHMPDSVKGMYVRNSSVHNTFSRCLTIHGARDWLLENNVCYEIEGHAMFFEDGVEERNILRNNLVVNAREAVRPLIGSDDEHVNSPAGIWLSNPNNHLYDNYIAGSEGTGIWYDVKKLADAPSTIVYPQYAGLEPNKRPMGENINNIVVGADSAGFFSDQYFPANFPVVENLTAFKNRNHNVWSESNGILFGGGFISFNNSAFLDSLVGVLIPGWGKVTNSIFVGESNNKGTSKQGDPTGTSGRTLPFPADAGHEIHGMRFYVGNAGVENSKFFNFQTNSQRGAGALGHRQNLFVGDSAGPYVDNVEFLNSNQVYIHSGGGRDSSQKSVMIHDRTGSVTGNSSNNLVSKHPMIFDNRGIYKPEWNGYIQPGPIGRLRIPCAAGCNHTYIRENDGARTDISFEDDGRMFFVMDKTYYMYRGDNSCSFDTVLESEYLDHWILIGVHYGDGCSLNSLARDGFPPMSLATSKQGVIDSKGTKYYYNPQSNKLYYLMYDDKEAQYTKGLWEKEGHRVMISGTGSNEIINPDNDPFAPKPGDENSEELEVEVCKSSDFNGDGFIDSTDFTLLSANFLQPVNPSRSKYDINNDSRIDSADFTEFSSRFLNICE